MPINAADFKRTSAEELLDGILETVKDTVSSQWNRIRDEIRYQLTFIAERTARVMTMLAAGKVTRKEADGTLHLLEVNLNSALKEFAFMAYAMTQKILSAVFDLLRNAIRNVTGIDLLL